MVVEVIFCGHEGCSMQAQGTYIVTVWNKGDTEALEKRMTVCAKHKLVAEANTLQVKTMVPPETNIESRWLDGFED